MLKITPDTPFIALGLPGYPEGEGPIQTAQQIAETLERIRRDMKKEA